jgi:hypothetical protein
MENNKDRLEERRTYNTGFCNIGADGITMNICNSIWHLFGQTSFNLAFCCYRHQQYFNLSADRQVGQRFRAEDFQIPQQHKARNRWLKYRSADTFITFRYAFTHSLRYSFVVAMRPCYFSQRIVMRHPK